MKRKRLLWIVSLLATITAAVWLVAPSQGPISRAAYGRIQIGMPKEDVLTIMKLPPGDYSDDFYTSFAEESEGHLSTGRRLRWINNHVGIEVQFGQDEEVCRKELYMIQTLNSISAKLRRHWWSIKSWIGL